MPSRPRFFAAALLSLLALPSRADDVPTLAFPAQYRDWVYLSTGFDMSYNPTLASMDHHMFDNVFVNQEAYREFLAKGRWPDGTMLVLEARAASLLRSLNKSGSFQGDDVMGVEVHMRDDKRGGWGFYAFDGKQPAARIPDSADCYSCHQAHAAVDTSFVQFYPTLLPIAEAKGTLSEAYRHDPER
jgi:hypothetical protein